MIKLLYVPGILSVLSLFLYAAFGYAWWSPLGAGDALRAALLAILHVFGLVFLLIPPQFRSAK